MEIYVTDLETLVWHWVLLLSMIYIIKKILKTNNNLHKYYGF